MASSIIPDPSTYQESKKWHWLFSTASHCKADSGTDQCVYNMPVSPLALSRHPGHITQSQGRSKESVLRHRHPLYQLNPLTFYCCNHHWRERVPDQPFYLWHHIAYEWSTSETDIDRATLATLVAAYRLGYSIFRKEHKQAVSEFAVYYGVFEFIFQLM